VTASSDASREVWDFVIIGSGFGGSVSALRLVEKGYRVLVLEKGRRLGADDFPKTNWALKRWLWLPNLGFRGLFKMTFLPHLTALSGVGVGGGSLVYANTLPVPKRPFFESGTWAGLRDWETELAPHYQTALRMLGAAPNPKLTYPDEVIREIGADMGRPEAFEMTNVAVHFGEPGKTVPDPYFGGRGPARTGCTFCGGCMLGCRHGAKNTLDKNYLYLAEQGGARVEPGHRGHGRSPRARRRLSRLGAVWHVRAPGGAGTAEFPGAARHLRRGRTRLRGASAEAAGEWRAAEPEPPRLGDYVRTNSEVLMGVVRLPKRPRSVTRRGHRLDFAHGREARISSPCGTPAGAGFFRMLALPHAPGETLVRRLAQATGAFLKSHPLRALRAFTVRDWAKQTMILLYMRAEEGHLRLRLGRVRAHGLHGGVCCHR
jgi:cholesterol oxidase